MYKGYLIDLDGTTYLGETVIKSARNKINSWINKGIVILFVTNNASKTNQEVADKLIKMGYNVSKDMIYTSANAMGEYLEGSRYKSCYLIGETSLTCEVKIKQTTNPEVVIIGYYNKVDYQMLAKACIYINNGADFLATNQDKAIPYDGGSVPGNGSIVKMIEYATGKDAVFVGKPTSIIMNYAIKKMGLKKNEICMIGDNYETDIMAGINCNIDTIFVATGFTKKEFVKKQELKPTHICDSLDTLDF